MPSLVSLWGALSPAQKDVLERLSEETASLEDSSYTENRNGFFLQLSMLFESHLSWRGETAHRCARTNLAQLVEDCGGDNSSVEKLKNLLEITDKFLGEELSERIDSAVSLEEKSQVLWDFIQFVHRAAYPEALSSILDQAITSHLERLRLITEREIGEGCKSPAGDWESFWGPMFRLRILSGVIFSEPELFRTVSQIYEHRPLSSQRFAAFPTDDLVSLIISVVEGPIGPGMALRIAPDGKSLQTFRPAGSVHFYAYLDPSKSFSSNPSFSWQILPLDKTLYDSHNAFDTKSHAFVAPVDGIFLFVGKILTHTQSTGNCLVMTGLNVNGKHVCGARHCLRGAQISRGSSDTFPILCKKGDRISLELYNTDGAHTAVFTNGGPYTTHIECYNVALYGYFLTEIQM